ncbi:MAG TPA: bifunctional nuclease family protein [Elusimicrobiales bacterium]|nr:bifunctional nuclease family protein [Elusimicrobiales bacterium]
MQKNDKELEIRIYSIATTANDAIVFLEEMQGIRLLPVWIGPLEGQAIAIKFSGIALPRPFTHDLMSEIISKAGYKMTKVVIDNVVDNTYYSSIYISNGKDTHQIDSRPSDAIAMSVRTGCSIYITEQVLNRSQVLNKPISNQEVEEFKTKLKDLKPTDIFKDLEKKNQAKKEKPKDNQ